MKHKLQKFLSLLLVLCAAITSSAQNYDGVNGKFKNGGTWLISGQILYIDAEIVPRDSLLISKGVYIVATKPIEGELEMVKIYALNLVTHDNNFLML